jgi:hypothetical protein
MRRSAYIFLVAVGVLSCTVSTFAQEKLWKELTTEFSMLYQQGRYSEAAKLAEEALTVAKKTFGTNHLIVLLWPHLKIIWRNFTEPRASMLKPNPFTSDH